MNGTNASVILISDTPYSYKSSFEIGLEQIIGVPFQIKTFGDSLLAISTLINGVNLVILHMGRRNAGEILRIPELKERYPNAKVVVMSVYARVGIHALDRGADGFLQIPEFKLEDLAAYIQ